MNSKIYLKGQLCRLQFISWTLLFSNKPYSHSPPRAAVSTRPPSHDLPSSSCFPSLVLEAEVAHADPDALHDDVHEFVVVGPQVVDPKLGLGVGGSTEGRPSGVFGIFLVAGNVV